MRHKNVVYMLITQDEYELPLAIADSRKELAEITGESPNYISSAIWHGERGDYKSKYIKVVLD